MTPTRHPSTILQGKVLYASQDAADLLAAHMAELDRPTPAWREVKQNASRTVYVGQVAGQAVYLKHFHGRSPLHRLARLVGYSRARREMHNAMFLSSREIPATPILAAKFANELEWLATQAVAPATPMNEWHAEQLARGAGGKAEIRLATIALADLIGRMHAVGVWHGDLHCGNVMVRTDRDRLDLVLMDLHRAGRRRMSRARCAANLAQLLHDRLEFTTRSQRLRFLKHYLAASGFGGSLRGWQSMVEAFGWRYRQRKYAHSDARIYRHNKYFSPLHLGRGWRGHAILASKVQPPASSVCRLEFTPENWAKALANPEGLFEGPGVQIIKDSRSSLVVRRKLIVGGHELDVYIKRPRRKYAYRFLVDCFRPSRALRAFRQGHQILARHVGTPLPLACLERRIGPVLVDSIVITEAVEGPKLDEFLSAWLSPPPRSMPAPDPQQEMTAAERHHRAQDVLWQMGQVLQRLHDSRFAHRDLKENNLLVWRNSHGGPHLVLVDLDGLRWLPYISTRRRFQGLMRLNVALLTCPAVSHAGRLRMLMGYLRRPGSGRIAFKPYWRVLEQWSRRKINQQIQSARRRQKAVRRPGP